MITIRIVGPASVFDLHDPEADKNWAPTVDDPAVLQTLHGLEHHEEFSEYLGDGGYGDLVEAGVTGGLLRFDFNTKTNQLCAVTEYCAPRLLTPTELARLKKYTIGQWSDGIGSNFFQDRFDHGLAPQPLFRKQEEVSAEQIALPPG